MSGRVKNLADGTVLEAGQTVLSEAAPVLIERLATDLVITAELRNIVYLTG